MSIRFFIDPQTNVPHIYKHRDKHRVSEEKIEEILVNPAEDRLGKEGSRIALGRTSSGRFLRVIYVPDPKPNSVFVITAYELKGKPLTAFRRRHRRKSIMKRNAFPLGWDKERGAKVLEHYETQAKGEAVMEDEAMLELSGQAFIEVPTELVPMVRKLLAKHKAGEWLTIE